MRKCSNPECNNIIKSASKTTKTCSHNCGQAYRLTLSLSCQQCHKPNDRKGYICSECKKANCLKQKKIDNAKRSAKGKPTDFIKRTGIPIRNDFMAKAYGWFA